MRNLTLQRTLHRSFWLSSCAILTLGVALSSPSIALSSGPAETEEKESTALEELIAGNERYIKGERAKLDIVPRREELAAGQHPKAIVLTCSDSRVPPELIFDQGLGDLFVIRNAGNVVHAFVLASIEYAAEHLHTGDLIVMGHEKCGAVTAALDWIRTQDRPAGHLELLLPHMAAPLKDLVAKGLPADQLMPVAVEANVRRSIDDIHKRSHLLGHLIESGELRVYGAVYDLASGKVTLLQTTAFAPAAGH